MNYVVSCSALLQSLRLSFSLSGHQCSHPLTKGIVFDDVQGSFQMYNSSNVNTLYLSLAIASDGIQMSLWASRYRK